MSKETLSSLIDKVIEGRLSNIPIYWIKKIFTIIVEKLNFLLQNVDFLLTLLPLKQSMPYFYIKTTAPVRLRYGGSNNWTYITVKPSDIPLKIYYSGTLLVYSSEYGHYDYDHLYITYLDFSEAGVYTQIYVTNPYIDLICSSMPDLEFFGLHPSMNYLPFRDFFSGKPKADPRINFPLYIINANDTDFSQPYFFNGHFNRDRMKCNTSNVTSLYRFFEGCLNRLLSLNTWNTKNLKTAKRLFYGCSNMHELSLANWTFENFDLDGLQEAFKECTSLSIIYGPIKNIKVPLDLSDCDLTLSSLDVILEGLSEVTNSPTITFSLNNYKHLETYNKLAIATSKGWTVISK